MPLTQDGKASGVSTTSTVAATLTTANANDVIVACISAENDPTSLLSVSSISGGGLTWAKRKNFTYGVGSKSDVEIWWAAAPSALASVTITATLSGTPDAAGICVFGISGANTASPWDANASLPATATGTASIPTVAGVSTTSPNTMLIAMVGTEGALITETAGAGFTLLNTTNQNGTNHATTVADEYQIVSATQSAISVAFGTTTPATIPWGMIVDAVVQASTSLMFMNPRKRAYLRR